MKTAEEILSYYERDEFYDKNIIKAMQKYAEVYHEEKLSEVSGELTSEEELNKIFPIDNFDSGEDDNSQELNHCNELRREGILWLKQKASMTIAKYNQKISQFERDNYESEGNFTNIIDLLDHQERQIDGLKDLLAKNQKEEAIEFLEWAIKGGFEYEYNDEEIIYIIYSGSDEFTADIIKLSTSELYDKYKSETNK